VIAASPIRGHTKSWGSHKLSILPVWTLKETLSAAVYFGGVAQEVVKERYACVNGAPRWLYDKSAYDKRRRDTVNCAEGIGDATLMKILKGDWMPVDESTTPSAIVSCERTRDAGRGDYSLEVFRSRLTSTLALTALAETMGESVIDALERSGLEDSTQMGHLFEALALHALTSQENAEWETGDFPGGDTKAGTSIMNFDVTNSERVENPESGAWGRWSNVGKGKILVPESRTFPVADALGHDWTAWQVTIAEYHAISSNGLETMFKHVPQNKRVQLFFLVPWYRVKDFKKQNSKNPANHELLRRVDQVVVVLTKDNLKKSLRELKDSGELQRQLALRFY
jgi:hypothetical protein